MDRHRQSSFQGVFIPTLLGNGVLTLCQLSCYNAMGPCASLLVALCPGRVRGECLWMARGS
eukprot:1629961-Amphidinium_carterae.1